MARYDRGQRGRLLRASGVADLTPESSSRDIHEAIVFAADLVRFGWDHDRALLYAEVIRHFEDHAIDIPDTIESTFFDRIYRDIAYGQVTEEEGSRLGAEDRPVVEPVRRGRGRAESDGDPRGQQRGRARGVAIESPPQVSTDPDRSKAPEEGESVESAGRGPRRRGLPF